MLSIAATFCVISDVVLSNEKTTLFRVMPGFKEEILKDHPEKNMKNSRET